MLTRTNKQSRSIGSTLDDAGIPYSHFGREDKYQPWGDGLTLLHRALESVRTDQKLQYKPGEIRWALEERLTDAAVEQSIEEINAMTPTELLQQMDLHYTERKRLQGALNADEWTAPAEVKVGTIHSAKGLEVPCVYLFDSMTAGVYRKYIESENAAEEHRLYYVGATRASETLRVVSGHESMGTEVFPPFADGLPGGDGR